MPDCTVLPPSREVFEAEIVASAESVQAIEDLGDMLIRYFCDGWMIHSIPGTHRVCVHLDDYREGWTGDSCAHALAVALLAEYDRWTGKEV